MYKHGHYTVYQSGHKTRPHLVQVPQLEGLSNHAADRWPRVWIRRAVWASGAQGVAVGKLLRQRGLGSKGNFGQGREVGGHGEGGRCPG